LQTPIEQPSKAFRFSFVSKREIASLEETAKEGSQWLVTSARNDTVSEHSQRSISK